MKTEKIALGLRIFLLGCLLVCPSVTYSQEPDTPFGESNTFVVNTNSIGFSQTAILMVTSVPDIGGVPLATSFGILSPNPFNPRIAISFNVGRPGPVELTIYDIAGRCVNHLVSEKLDAGEHTRQWDGRDSRGSMMPAGVYLVQISSEFSSDSKKITLVK